jgi:hypothetical protein
VTNGREVDLDLLADYIGGALDGTPEAAAVERLIADDPAWIRAYAQTSAAMEAVRVDLSTLGAEWDQMPAEVLGRLEAALAPVLPEESGKVVRLAERRRWVRRLVPVAVAAGVLACVGLGVTVLRPGSSSQNDATTSAAGRAADTGAAPGAGTLSAGGNAPKVAPGDAQTPERAVQKDASAAPPIVATGTDYTRQTVARIADEARTSARAQGYSGAVPPELSRLADPAALAACLFSIKEAYAQPGASVRLVDLARFEGSPAVVVLLPDSVWVSGPACGQAGPDTRYSTRTQSR